MRVTYELADEPLVIGCERVLTGQVVLNLCFNAIEEMANWPEQERVVQVRTSRNGPAATFVVVDRGKGLAHIPDGRIFDGAFTSKATGHGIGLALSHRIITRQGGTIAATENPPHGAVFEFSMPLA